MKTAYLYIFSLVVFFCSCAQKDILNSKQGTSLPPVTNLALEKADSNRVILTWQIPGAIPGNINQPLGVYIEVNQEVNRRLLSQFSITLPGAPTSYTYKLPDSSKVYHLTVKLSGTTTSSDINYSNSILSLGQTVIYTR
jgi:hypothetical protein